MNKDEIIKLITDTVSKLTSNATSPHRHNGVDALQIPITNLLILPGTGVPFINGRDKYNMFITESFGGVQALVIEPGSNFISGTPESNTSSFYIGAGGVVQGNSFGDVNVYTNGLQASTHSYQEASSTDTNLVSSIDVRPEQVAVTTDVVNLLASNTGTFAVQFPNAPRPAPIAGMIAFEGGTFFACEVTGTWRTIVTA